ncbi:ADP-ribosylation [Coprinopsis marcescibilis]|uniref:ADP-ribosylation n=1 Tax=Coprinopsis marcescibilis TaxID=230819 RepID=A0A5C3L4H1_COPMA|nr:ADP-ribosylation [Coprinopsis marcescibilis]
MASMAQHIPMALSFLSSVASGLHKAHTPAPLPPAPAVPLQNVSNLPPGNATSSAGNSTGAVSVPSNTSGNSTAGSSGIAISPIALCISCQAKPKYFDGSKTHPYCSKTCATTKPKSAPNGFKTGSGGANGNCDFCRNRPKYTDGARTHDYCSKACARHANPQRKQSALAPASGQTCQAPGCTNPPHPTGDYCSLAHKTLSENLCILCMKAPKMATSHFCSQTCIDDAEKKGPCILEVPNGHVTFKSVADQFKASWRHTNSTCPTVRRIYKIILPANNLATFDTYKASVEAKGQFGAQGRSPGNENRRWHGTRRACNLGDKGHLQFCSTQTCSLCSIIRNSYDISLWGKKTGWGRFGKGIYTSSTSSKSNDYSHNDCKSQLKAILLNKVVVGKGCKMLQDSTSLTAAPAGFDSVLAEKGGSLNYDELVVYTNDAIRPSFLVMYDEP